MPIPQNTLINNFISNPTVEIYDLIEDKGAVVKNLKENDNIIRNRLFLRKIGFYEYNIKDIVSEAISSFDNTLAIEVIDYVLGKIQKNKDHFIDYVASVSSKHNNDYVFNHVSSRLKYGQYMIEYLVIKYGTYNIDRVLLHRTEDNCQIMVETAIKYDKERLFEELRKLNIRNIYPCIHLAFQNKNENIIKSIFINEALNYTKVSYIAIYEGMLKIAEQYRFYWNIDKISYAAGLNGSQEVIKFVTNKGLKYKNIVYNYTGDKDISLAEKMIKDGCINYNFIAKNCLLKNDVDTFKLIYKFISDWSDIMYILIDMDHQLIEMICYFISSNDIHVKQSYISIFKSQKLHHIDKLNNLLKPSNELFNEIIDNVKLIVKYTPQDKTELELYLYEKKYLI